MKNKPNFIFKDFLSLIYLTTKFSALSFLKAITSFSDKDKNYIKALITPDINKEYNI